MSKRKRKKQQAQEELLSLVMIGLSLVVYYFTKSISLAITTFITILLLLISVLAYKKKAKELRLKRSGIRDIDQMDGVQFEHYLIALFKQLGYKAKITPSTNDFGADLLLNIKNKKIVVQAKRYKSKVGIKAVQEVVSAISYYKSHEAWVITNNYFTSQASKLAKTNNVKLIDRDDLIDMILKVNPSVNTKVKKGL